MNEKLAETFPLEGLDLPQFRAFYFEMFWLMIQQGKEMMELFENLPFENRKLFDTVPLPIPLQFTSQTFSLPASALRDQIYSLFQWMDDIYAVIEEENDFGDEEEDEDDQYYDYWDFIWLIRDNRVLLEEYAEYRTKIANCPTYDDDIAGVSSEDVEECIAVLEPLFLTALFKQEISDPISLAMILEWASLRSITTLDTMLDNPILFFDYLAQVDLSGKCWGEILEDLRQKIEHHFEIWNSDGWPIKIAFSF